MAEQMLRIRAFEAQANQLYLSAKMPGLTHLYIGEEAVAVGVCSALRRTTRSRRRIAATVTASRRAPTSRLMFCELLGKEEGYCRARAARCTSPTTRNGNLGANAIVGGSAGIATGAAFRAKRLGTDRVSVCFFGEGALGQGLLYEVMNMAALWKLPVVYVCENNLYNEYTNYDEVTAGLDPGARRGVRDPGRGGRRAGRRRGLRGGDARRRARARRRAARRSCSARPTATTATTSATSTAPTTARRRRSSCGRPSATRSRCSRARLGDDDAVAELRERVEAEVAAAVAYALAAPYPDPGEVTNHVFA